MESALLLSFECPETHPTFQSKSFLVVLVIRDHGFQRPPSLGEIAPPYLPIEGL